MHSSKSTTNPTRNVIRWIARVISILFIGIYGLMFMSQGINVSNMTPREWLSLFFFPFGASLGMILAWWQEGVGGAVTIASVFASILIHDPSSGGAYMWTCASPGLLFLFSWAFSLSQPDLKN